jgi:hypothetical protein
VSFIIDEQFKAAPLSSRICGFLLFVLSDEVVTPDEDKVISILISKTTIPPP